MDKRVIESREHEGLCKASPIIIKEDCFPSRIVLRRLFTEYVTHVEVLKGNPKVADDTGTGCMFEHLDYTGGHYFSDIPAGKSESFQKAIADYAKRVKEM